MLKAEPGPFSQWLNKALEGNSDVDYVAATEQRPVKMGSKTSRCHQREADSNLSISVKPVLNTWASPTLGALSSYSVLSLELWSSSHTGRAGNS